MLKATIGSVFLLALILSVGYGLSRTMSTSNIQFNVNDLPNHGLVLVSPSDPAFDTEVASLVSDNPSELMRFIEAAKPFCVFIKNTGPSEIAGYRLKWDLLKDDGEVMTNWSSVSAPGLLVGNESPSGGMTMAGALPIRPGTTHFVSWESVIADFLYSSKNGRANQTEETLKKQNAIMLQVDTINKEKTQSVVGVTVSIDCAYFADGTFVGPDTGSLFAQTQAYIDAQRDLGQLVRQHIQEKRSSSELFDKIKSLAEETDATLGPNPTMSDYKNLYIKVEARHLLRIRDQGGDSSAMEYTQQPLGKTWVKLHRKGEHN